MKSEMMYTISERERETDKWSVERGLKSGI